MPIVSEKPLHENSNKESQSDQLREAGSPYDLELPIDPTFSSRPPKGTWENGYRLSVLALEQVRNRPQIFEERAQRMCSAEFVL
jgi:hypothetical protein